MIKLFFVACLLAVACNSSEPVADGTSKDTAVTDDTYIATTPIPLGGCYGWAINNDTATMEFTVTGNVVTGTLQYDWNEKDANKGVIRGVIENDLLLVDYVFESEGTTSVREVAFKIQGNELTEGFGEYKTGGDTLRFESKAQLKFQDDRSFKKVDCKD